MAPSLAPVVVLDTSAIIYFISSATPDEPPIEATKRQLTKMHFDDLEKQRARWVVPTLVMAEFHRDVTGIDVIRQLVIPALKRVRVAAFDSTAAQVAGEMLKHSMKKRPKSKPREVMKMDSLIAATAHAIGAAKLLTSNPADMIPLLASISSPVEVVDCAAQPKQTVITSVMSPPTKK